MQVDVPAQGGSVAQLPVAIYDGWMGVGESDCKVSYVFDLSTDIWPQ
jgi:hypothetical protein